MLIRLWDWKLLGQRLTRTPDWDGYWWTMNRVSRERVSFMSSALVAESLYWAQGCGGYLSELRIKSGVIWVWLRPVNQSHQHQISDLGALWNLGWYPANVKWLLIFWFCVDFSCEKCWSRYACEECSVFLY